MHVVPWGILLVLGNLLVCGKSITLPTRRIFFNALSISYENSVFGQECIDIEYGAIKIKRPTKKKGQLKTVTVRLITEHIDEIKRLKEKSPALPHIPFFRHVAGISGVQKDDPFGEKYLYKWAKRACKALNISGLDLYGLTRHTTVTALAKSVGEHGAKKASGHDTNKAFARYCQYQDDDTFEMVQIAAELKGKVIKFEKQTAK